MRIPSCSAIPSLKRKQGDGGLIGSKMRYAHGKENDFTELTLPWGRVLRNVFLKRTYWPTILLKPSFQRKFVDDISTQRLLIIHGFSTSTQLDADVKNPKVWPYVKSSMKPLFMVTNSHIK